MSFNNIYRGRKVLLTGHTGFKGSWMAIWLKQLGAEVYGYALAPSSDDDNFVQCNLAAEINHQEADVRDLQQLKSYFKQVQPDIAFHLAAQPLVLLSYQDPVSTFETNLMGGVNFFEAVRATPSVKVAINVTSDKCYDNKEWVWGYRESDPMGGKDPYSASKGCAELITSSYASSFFNKTGACRIASARAGNVIGGGDWAPDRIVPDFFRAVKRGEKLQVRNPLATRPWQHVLEPLSGYLWLAAQLFGDEKYVGGWNFGPSFNGNVSVKDLTQALISYSGKGEVETQDYSAETAHEAHLLKLDISKAAHLLKWQPVLTFDQTVEFTVKGYQDEFQERNLFAGRVEQIALYKDLAVKKDIKWATT